MRCVCNKLGRLQRQWGHLYAREPVPLAGRGYEVYFGNMERNQTEMEAAQAVVCPGNVAHADAAPSITGFAHIDFAETDDPTRFGIAERHERLTLAPSILPLPQLPMWCSIEPHPVLVEDHEDYPPPPGVAAYALRDASIIGQGFVVHGNRFVYLPDCFPGYMQGDVNSGAIAGHIRLLRPDAWAMRREVRIDHPVSCPVHWNFVYGHFLLEMLPRLAGLALLRRLGVHFTLALPAGLADWAKDIAALYFAPGETLWFQPETDIIVAPSILLTSMMHEKYNFHPAFNEMLLDLKARVGVRPEPELRSAPPRPERRLYLSRREVGYNDRLLNAEEIEAAAAELGFEIVHPQKLSFAEQVRLFDTATVVMGEATSALHNTLFSRTGTKVISLNAFSWYQNSISRLRQQPLAYVAPDDGHFRHWRIMGNLERRYRIDPATLRGAVFAMVPQAEMEWRQSQLPPREEPVVTKVRPAASLTALPATPEADPAEKTSMPVPATSPAWDFLRGPPPAPPTAPRRGFLARLFGRGR
jgi:capsular polysaccharide biosynthesis protein